MAKKVVLALLIAAMVTGGAFAIDMSAGIGGDLGFNFAKYKYDGDYAGKGRNMSFGFNAFFDATYAMASLGLNFTGPASVGDSDENWEKVDKEYRDSITYFTIGVFGKYPIDLGGFTVFPIAGLKFNLAISHKVDGDKIDYDDAPESRGYYLNFISLRFGAGADIGITDQIYVRPTLLWGPNFGTKADRESKSDDDNIKYFKHSFDIGIAVGYKF